MKYFKLFLTSAIIFSVTYPAMASDVSESEKAEIQKSLEKIYTDFAMTVKSKKDPEHLALYLYDTAPVNIINKTADGPQDSYTTVINKWVNYFSNMVQPYELKISNPEFKILSDRMAISIADFAEFEDNKNVSNGTDVFTYIKTDKGWKLAALHNTVVIKNAEPINSKNIVLKNNIKDFPAMLKKAIKAKDKYEMQKLFQSPLNPYFGFQKEFTGEFNYIDQTVGGTIDRIVRIPYAVDYEFSDIKVEIFDQYIATLIMDHVLYLDGKKRSAGQQLWILYPTVKSGGWKISSIFYHID